MTTNFDPNAPETEEGATQAEAIRRERTRRMAQAGLRRSPDTPTATSKAPPAQTPASSQSPSSTPATTASSSADSPATPR